jgi:selenocysteine lyase/cysteine desulfurase
MGDYLRTRLRQANWQIVNDTPLPVVCFRSANKAHDPAGIVLDLVNEGKVWISNVRVPELAIRACITNYQTTEEDVDALIDALEEARQSEA